MAIAQKLALAFHETHSFKWDKEKGFTLASGFVSPFYVDCRALMANPSARRLVGQLAYDALDGLGIDCLGGLEIRCHCDRDDHLGLCLCLTFEARMADVCRSQAGERPWARKID